MHAEGLEFSSIGKNSKELLPVGVGVDVTELDVVA